MSLDLSKDYLVVDDLESLSYYSKTGEGTYANVATIQNVFWSALDQLDYQTHPSLLEKNARAVHCWTSQLGSITPKMDDKIVDAFGATWFVAEEKGYDLDKNGIQRYRLTCWKDTTGTNVMQSAIMTEMNSTAVLTQDINPLLQ